MISVIVPTYKREADLLKCLEGLQRQERLPDEIIVVVRDTDHATRAALEACVFDKIRPRIAFVSEPGQVAALNAGLEHSMGDIIAITDDDTIPRTHWLKQIEHWFAQHPEVGGVGGRDWLHLENGLIEDVAPIVGRVSWFGRVTGNHHLGMTQREVDILKGANMSYRREAIRNIRFDQQLKGSGAQVHNDMAFSLAVKKAGWRLIYDPLVAVDHYPAPRQDTDQRNAFNPLAQFNSAFNETLILRRYLGGFKGMVFLVWALCIGTSSAPGIAQVMRLLLMRRSQHLFKRFFATLQGRWQARGMH